jgi:hypothetical protein
MMIAHAIVIPCLDGSTAHFSGFDAFASLAEMAFAGIASFQLVNFDVIAQRAILACVVYNAVARVVRHGLFTWH